MQSNKTAICPVFSSLTRSTWRKIVICCHNYSQLFFVLFTQCYIQAGFVFRHQFSSHFYFLVFSFLLLWDEWDTSNSVNSHNSSYEQFGVAMCCQKYTNQIWQLCIYMCVVAVCLSDSLNVTREIWCHVSNRVNKCSKWFYAAHGLCQHKTNREKKSRPRITVNSPWNPSEMEKCVWTGIYLFLHSEPYRIL